MRFLNIYNFLMMIAASFLFACNATNNPKSSNALTDSLKTAKLTIDAQLSPKTLEIWVKRAGQKEITQVINNRFPAGIEISYNVFKDKSGVIRYLSESPTSPDREWFIAYRNYFDEKGNLFAFQRLNNFFGSECTKGAAIENLTKFYDQHFKLADSVYTLTNSNKDTLDKAKCKFPYNFKYEVFRSLKEYKEAKGITAF